MTCSLRYIVGPSLFQIFENTLAWFHKATSSAIQASYIIIASRHELLKGDWYRQEADSKEYITGHVNLYRSASTIALLSICILRF